MNRVFLAIFLSLIFLQSPSAAETVRINGVDMYYETKGVGEPVLLLHGFGSCGAEWASVTDALAEKYRVIVVDMRGHGKSTNPSGRFSHRQSADDVLSLMDHLTLKQARAIGFSSGGMTLLHAAIKSPDRLNKLVLISATTHFPEQAREILRGVSYETMPPPVREQYERCATRGTPQVRELVNQFRAFGHSQDDMNLKPVDLARIKASTLIVHGDRDPFFPVSIPVAMYAHIPGSALWIVPNGDHSPQAGAEDGAFMRTISEFLAK